MTFDFTSASQKRELCDQEEQHHEREICKIRTRRNESAPISSLPPEILATIFFLCREVTCDPRCECHEGRFLGGENKAGHVVPCEPKEHGLRHLNLLTLARVCRAWCTFVMGTPTFWDVIDLTYPRSILTAMKPLRCDVPVSVSASMTTTLCCGLSYVPSYLPRIRSTFEWLLENCSTIKCLKIALPMRCLRSVIDVLTDHPARFTTLKCLELRTSELPHFEPEDIDIDPSASGWGDVNNDTVLGCTSLNSLTLTHVEMPPWIPLTSISALKNLTLCLPVFTLETFQDLLRLLEQCMTTLEDLSIGALDDREDSEEQFLLAAEVLPKHQPLCLPHLQNLFLHYSAPYYFRHQPSNWIVHFTHAFLKAVDAPRSHCRIAYPHPDLLLEHVRITPMTPEWGEAIGEYGIVLQPGYYLDFTPLEVRGQSNTSSIIYPRITAPDFLAPDDHRLPVESTGVIGLTFSKFIKITSCELYLPFFHETYLVENQECSRHQPNDRFLEEYRNLSKLTSYDSLVAYRWLDKLDTKRSRALSNLLTAFPDVHTVQLTGLLGLERHDAYLGKTLSGIDPTVPHACSQYKHLKIKYEYGVKHSYSIYLPWLYELILYRQAAVFRAREEGSTPIQPLESIEVQFPSFHHQVNKPLVKGKTNLQRNVEAQVEEILRRCDSGIDIQVLVYDMADNVEADDDDDDE